MIITLSLSLILNIDMAEF